MNGVRISEASPATLVSRGGLGGEVVEIKQWFTAGVIELTNGGFVKPIVITLERINSEMINLERDYHFESDAIVLKKVSIEEIRKLLPILEESGVFNNMQKYDRIEL